MKNIQDWYNGVDLLPLVQNRKLSPHEALIIRGNRIVLVDSILITTAFAIAAVLYATN